MNAYSARRQFLAFFPCNFVSFVVKALSQNYAARGTSLMRASRFSSESRKKVIHKS
jgi:hypothetical protein